MPSSKQGPAVEAATNQADEHKFIAAIVADLPNDDLRLVYADWLEERGDARSVYIRQLVAAAAGSTKAKFPDSRPFARAWTNMLGTPLLKGIVEHGLTEVRDAVLRVARPILTIETEPVKESLIGTGGSKFGGHPDLPGGVAWPTCAYGPLGFLGQIALGDMHDTQVGRELPQDGLLSFFAYQNFETGHQPGVEKDAGDTCVLHTPAAATLERREPPNDLNTEGNAILPACRLTMCETWDLPDCEDKLPRSHAADLKKLQKSDLGSALHELRSACHSFGHHLLGYSVHFRTSDPSPGATWRHLLCLHSDDNLGWSWCDGEHLAVYVHKDDLRKGTFRRIYGYAS